MSQKSNPSFSEDHPLMDELHAYLDQELDQELTLEIEDHLKSCPSCQVELSHLEDLRSRLQSLPEIAIGSDFSQAVLSAIQAKNEIPKGLSWTLVIEGIAAGVVMSLLIPAIQTSVWAIRLLDIQFELRAAINIFLTQIASNWILWWAKLQLDFSQISNLLNTSTFYPTEMPSPWIFIGVGSAAVLLMNFIILRSSFQLKNNGNKK